MMAFPYLTPEKEHLIPRKILFAHPNYTQPKVSPDGSYIAFLSPDENDILNIWIRPRTESAAVQVTFQKNEGIKEYHWQEDSRHILYAKDTNGDNKWHLFQVNLLTRNHKDLTPFEKTSVQLVSLSDKKPHHALVAFNKERPALPDLYVMDLTNGKLELLEKNPGDTLAFYADNHLEVKASKAITKEGKTLFRIKTGEEWKDILTYSPEDFGTDIVGVASDDPLLYFKGYFGKDTVRLAQYNTETKEWKTLFAHEEYDISHVLQNPISSNIDAVAYHGDRYEWGVVNPLFKDHLRTLKQIPGDVYLINRDKVDRYWTLSYVNDDAPNKYYLYDTRDRKLQFLFSEKEELTEYTFAKLQPIHFKTRDGMMIQGYIARPKTEKKVPLVVYVHGGALARDKWGFSPVVQWLVNRGYGVLLVNYRGSAGFGKKYLYAGRKEWARKRHFDLIDAKNWVIDQGWVDKDKVAIAGSSLGGYAALVGMTFTPDEFCCGVSHVGPSNLITFLHSLPPHFKAMQSLINGLFGDLKKEQNLLKERSPFFRIDKIRKPLLIAQGANDPIVPKSESDQFVKGMREKKIPVDYLLFPNEGHKILHYSNRIKYFAAFESFLSEHLGGKLEEVSREEKWEGLFN